MEDVEDVTMTIISQAYWDDLFNIALSTVKAIPLEP